LKIKFEEIGIAQAKEFHKLLLDEIETLQEDIFTLDFTNVEEIDLCTIQILLSLQNYCKSSEIQLQFTNINSTQVIQSIQTFRLQESLGIDI
jgi:anti-anti-sigma regulatory factor